MDVGDLDDRSHLRAEVDLIEQALEGEFPILGVCLGSQLLAHVLGADVRPGPQKEIGWDEVQLTAATAYDPLFRGVDDPFPAFHWHGDVFALPDGTTRLAYGPDRASGVPVRGRRLRSALSPGGDAEDGGVDDDGVLGRAGGGGAGRRCDPAGRDVMGEGAPRNGRDRLRGVGGSDLAVSQGAFPL